MPPDLPIAVGAKVGVRDHVRWAQHEVPLLSPDSVSSVDTDTDSDVSSFEDDLSSPASSFSDLSGGHFPPSPPVHLAQLAKKFATDYFNLPTTKATFLDRVFVKSNSVLDAAIPVKSEDGKWNLALYEEGTGEGVRTLYAQGAFEQVNMRENLVELLDMADEELACDQVVVVLDKADAHFATTLHSLMYVGGTVVAPSAAIEKPSVNFVLVGIDL